MQRPPDLLLHHIAMLEDCPLVDPKLDIAISVDMASI
jgi:hypothetical protein